MNIDHPQYVVIEIWTNDLDQRGRQQYSDMELGDNNTLKMNIIEQLWLTCYVWVSNLEAHMSLYRTPGIVVYA